MQSLITRFQTMKFHNTDIDAIIYPLVGFISSLTFMSILDLIGTIIMAFLVGAAGALGGVVVKKLIDKFSKKKK